MNPELRRELRRIATDASTDLALLADVCEEIRDAAHTPEHRRNARHVADEARYLRREIATFETALDRLETRDHNAKDLQSIGNVIARLNLSPLSAAPAARSCDIPECLLTATHCYHPPDRDPRYYCAGHAPGDAYTVAL